MSTEREHLLAAISDAADDYRDADERLTDPHPCYCLPGPARCDEPHNWCDRPRVHNTDRMRDGLRLIDRNGCENLTRGRCSDDPGRTRDSEYTSTQWCPPCIAADALDGDA